MSCTISCPAAPAKEALAALDGLPDVMRDAGRRAAAAERAVVDVAAGAGQAGSARGEVTLVRPTRARWHHLRVVNEKIALVAVLPLASVLDTR